MHFVKGSSLQIAILLMIKIYMMEGCFSKLFQLSACFGG
ncbi:uncharacterized protein J3R85_009452 [Psidium guajava]|nr:uncharacterized protein J3R85_009452 [Psidium guajava]